MGAKLSQIRIDALGFVVGSAIKAVGIGLLWGLGPGLISFGFAIMLLTIIW